MYIYAYTIPIKHPPSTKEIARTTNIPKNPLPIDNKEGNDNELIDGIDNLKCSLSAL